MSLDLQVRAAVPADVPALRELIEASVRRLQAHDYSAEQMEAALRTVFGVDSQLIDDGTYFAAEVIPSRGEPGSLGSPAAGEGRILVGCGGWSRRKTLYGGDRWRDRQDDLLDPRVDAAKIRAFFIHPDWARQGIGTRVLDACEAAAAGAGFTRFEMGATLTGAKLFGRRGYVPLQQIDLPLEDGIILPIIHMSKEAR